MPMILTFWAKVFYSNYRRQRSIVDNMAGVSRVPAAQWRKYHSGGILGCTRRVCVNSAALLSLPAVLYDTKFFIQRQPHCFPPFTPATIFSTLPTLTCIVILNLFL
jgi:hypothetical protein